MSRQRYWRVRAALKGTPQEHRAYDAYWAGADAFDAKEIATLIEEDGENIIVRCGFGENRFKDRTNRGPCTS
jgi:hypothetical protein